ncbi:MAG: hypothetical protein AMXMBFR76_19930 [Pseudomonadota bacterium]
MAEGANPLELVRFGRRFPADPLVDRLSGDAEHCGQIGDGRIQSFPDIGEMLGSGSNIGTRYLDIVARTHIDSQGGACFNPLAPLMGARKIEHAARATDW